MGFAELLFLPLVAGPLLAACAALLLPPVVMARHRLWTRHAVVAWLGGVVALGLWVLAGVTDSQGVADQGPAASGSGDYSWAGNLGWLVVAVLLTVRSVHVTRRRAQLPAA
jgi:hypothetical protein